MTKTEFFKQLDKMLLTGTGSITDLIEKYMSKQSSWSDYHYFADYLAEYLNKKNYHPSSEQINELWQLAAPYKSTDLIDTLLRLQGGKYNSTHLFQILKAEFYDGVTHLFELSTEYPDIYQSESNEKLYQSLKLIVQDFEKFLKGEDILLYFLQLWNPLPVFQKDLNQLIYEALVNCRIKATKILLEFGADPFANYWEEDVDTGVPIIFKAIQNEYIPVSIKVLIKYKQRSKKWNVIDEWGRNLLHYATNNEMMYEQLLKKGVNPDHRALIDDQAKVVIGKMNDTLPKEYGKTPQELVGF